MKKSDYKSRQRKVVLIVEDDSAIAEVIQIILEGEGFSVIIDPTGEVTEKSAIVETIDLALVDFLLPGRNGVDVIEGLRAKKGLEDLPVILMSANSESELAEAAKNSVVADYLAKPFDVDELILMVRKYV